MNIKSKLRLQIINSSVLARVSFLFEKWKNSSIIMQFCCEKLQFETR